LRVLWRKIRNRRLFSYDELQFGHQIHNEKSVRAQRFTNVIAPSAQICFALRQKGTDEVLKGLRQSGVGDVALVLVELAGRKKAAGRNKHFMELIYDGGLADTRVSGNEHQLRPPAGYDTIEG